MSLHGAKQLLDSDAYAMAGAIFDKYGWNESNTVLWYNIGETWNSSTWHSPSRSYGTHRRSPASFLRCRATSNCPGANAAELISTAKEMGLI